MFDKSDNGKKIREEVVVDSGAVECVTSKNAALEIKSQNHDKEKRRHAQ